MSDGFSLSSYIINKTNLINNCLTIKSKLNQNAKLCAVVKSDAYGVGAGVVSKIIYPFVDEYAVANLKEGIQLRRIIKDKPIIVLAPTICARFAYYAKHNLIMVVSKIEDAKYLAQNADVPISVELKIDSGMHRFGFCSFYELLEAESILKTNENINIVGLYSHLATKENDVLFMLKQKAKFGSIVDEFLAETNTNLEVHISNSNAAIMHPDFNYDMVRVGFGLYGMDNKFGLKPVVEIKTKLVNIKKIKKGESVGYNRTFVAPSDMTIGVVPLGYADGINRRLSNVGFFIIDGTRCKIVGNVCMDVCMVDLTPIKAPKLYSEAVFLGRQKNESISIEEIAIFAGTSEYDILTGLRSKRMKRRIKA